MSAPSMNGSDAVKPTAASVAGSSKQQVKSSQGGKSLDGVRAQAASPVDGQKAKSYLPQPKAWQGHNPITQRSSNHTPNGTDKVLPKNSPHSPTPPQTQSKNIADSHPDKHAHDRALFLFASLTGSEVTVTLRNGEQFTGIFSGGSFESNSKHKYILKMVKRAKFPTQPQVNGNTELSGDYVGEGEDHMMVFDKEDTIELAADNIALAVTAATQNGSISSSFRTDTEISGRDPSMPRERQLQRWQPDAESNISMSLEASNVGEWDQFAANERMYGVESTYDENIYTTAINREDPRYTQLEATAARIASEIENSAPATAHVAEERLLDADSSNALDEEEKYSGVQRESSALPKRGAGAYVPPSQRPITNVPTVPGAPFDPAIISLEKPSSTNATPKPESSATAAERAITPVTQPSMAADDTESSSAQPAQAAKKQVENTAEEHVRNAAEAFKQFANDQKLRARITAENRRSTARAEKNVRLNDLKKFSENFKLKSRVPDDLVPILAKDPEKQIEIQHRAAQAAQQEEEKAKERESQKPAATTSPTPSSSSQAAPPAVPAVEQRLPPAQQQGARTRLRDNLRGVMPQPIPNKLPPQGPMAANRTFPRGGVAPPLSGDVRVPTGPAMEGTLSPPPKLNIKAFEFRPGASSFTPSGTSPSPQRTTTGSSMDRSTVSASVQPAKFFEKDKKPADSTEQKELEGIFLVVGALLDGDYKDEHKKVNAANGGVPRPYQTLPTYPFGKGNINATHLDFFVKPAPPNVAPSPMQGQVPNGQMQHGHSIPPHMHGPPMSTPTQRPPYMQSSSQPGASPQVFDPRMQQFGPNGSVQSSPRFPNAQMSFNGQMPGPMPGMGMPQFPGQGMQGYGMSPGMQYRQMNMPPTGPMMMMPPNQQHGQVAPMQHGYPPRGPGGPQYNPQMMGGVPMMQQQSAGGYMNGPMPPGQSYSPMPPPSQPHMVPHMQNQGYGGNARPHMMQHSGSHQGFQPGGGMMQPPYGGAPSPGQHYPYHMQQRQMSSGGGGGGGYPQMTPRQQFSVPNHPSPGMGGAVQGPGDEGK